MIELDDTALRGSIPPLVTPFRDGEVDHDAYAGLIAHQVDNGSHGVLVNGPIADDIDWHEAEAASAADPARFHRPAYIDELASIPAGETRAYSSTTIF